MVVFAGNEPKRRYFSIRGMTWTELFFETAVIICYCNPINNTDGHDTGDAVLKVVSDAIKNGARPP
jgi:hypothetical protein